MKFFLYLLIPMMCVDLFAQEIAMKKREFSFSVGFAEMNVQKFMENGDLDFLNYLDSDPDYLDFITVKFGYKHEFSSRLSMDFILILMDDIVPDNFNFTMYYSIGKTIELGVGAMLYKNYFTGYEQYLAKNSPDYFLVDQNIQQFKSYDLGFYISPKLNLVKYKWITTSLRLDFGLSAFLNEESTFYLKRKFSNERLQHRYNIKMNFQPFINPKIELRLHMFRIKNTSMGVMVNSNFFYGKRSMNYSQHTYKWTSENKFAEEIKAPKHEFSRFEFDGGFYLRW